MNEEDGEINETIQEGVKKRYNQSEGIIKKKKKKKAYLKWVLASLQRGIHFQFHWWFLLLERRQSWEQERPIRRVEALAIAFYFR